MSRSLLTRVRSALPWIAAALFLLAAFSVGRTLRRHGVDALWHALDSVDPADVAAAAALAAGSYATLTLFDWLAVRSVTTARLAYPRIALASFTALSLGHTVGFSALSSATVRYRFYSRHGLGEPDVARIVLFSAATVAVGLAGVAGVGCLFQPETVAAFAGVPAPLAASLGGLSLLAVCVYVAAAARAGRGVRVMGWRLPLPSARSALLQVGIGCGNYVLVAATLHGLLGESADGISLLSFASLYAVANALAILSHVPGGFGVLEAIVLSVLPGADALGALILFRLLYHFVPFLIGALCYAGFELRHVPRAAPGASGSGPPDEAGRDRGDDREVVGRGD